MVEGEEREGLYTEGEGRVRGRESDTRQLK